VPLHGARGAAKGAHLERVLALDLQQVGEAVEGVGDLEIGQQGLREQRRETSSKRQTCVVTYRARRGLDSRKSLKTMSEIALQAAHTAAGSGAAVAHGGASASAQAAEMVWQWRSAPAADDRVKAAAAARRKGLLGGAIGLAVATALWFWKPGMSKWVAGIAVATTLLALVSPLGGFRRLTHALEVFARGVGLALTWLLMGVAYYLLFLPVGLLLRALGKLHITRGADARRTSYWQEPTAPPPSLDAYRRPF